jgi:hypothetical protein
MTYSFLLDAVQYIFVIEVLADTWHHICRILLGVKTVPRVPMESSRVHVDGAAVSAFYDELEAVLEGVPATFISNVDDTRCSKWVDASEITVLVPDKYTGSLINIPVDRNSRRSTLVGAIAAD